MGNSTDINLFDVAKMGVGIITALVGVGVMIYYIREKKKEAGDYANIGRGLDDCFIGAGGLVALTGATVMHSSTTGRTPSPVEAVISLGALSFAGIFGSNYFKKKHLALHDEKGTNNSRKFN